MSAMRRPTSMSSSTTTSSRSRHSTGGPGASDRSSVTSRSSMNESSPPPLTSNGTGTIRASALSRGATARAAVQPPPSRTGSANGIKRGSPVPDRSASPALSDALEGALRREVEEKEELMMRLASRDESIAELQAQISEMRVTMGFGEGRLSELYADQERWESERARLEEELAKKNNVIDKLRAQLREIEKESRDSTRRLAEQAAQFESERQAFYDNTAHLKSRIQSLTDAQKDWKASQREASPEAEQQLDQGQEQEPRKVNLQQSSGREEPDEPPEMTALRLELSTLETSHGSLGQTVKALQSQLVEVQRVNAELQEENEAYTTLLREKTLSGQIDIMRHGPEDHEDDQESASGMGLDSELAESERHTESERHASMSPVETRRVVSHTHSLRRAVSPARSGRSGRSARRVAAETLADLPVAGPGLDLAAELGRAENWDADVDVDSEEKQKQQEQQEEKAKEEAKTSNAELETLRAEIKQLKDANKALSLYASKIIDRIISQEGFEHVLAADYTAPAPKTAPLPKIEAPRPRTMSLLARAKSLSISSPAPPSPALRPSPLTINTEPAQPVAGGLEPSTPLGKRQNRGLSMDWSRFNPFSRGNQEAAQTPIDPKLAGLKPLTLRADLGLASPGLSSPIVQGSRKLDNEEDEEDRKERERLNAHMKLMGVEKEQGVNASNATAMPFPISRGSSSGADTPNSRLSVGWGRRPESARQDSSGSGVRIPSEDLKAEHLELEDEAQVTAAAETRIAALDKREKVLSAEIAKGRGGGFTEPPGRGSRVRRRSNASATSTLFSAGRMSRGGSEADIGEDEEGTI
ncbi:TATA element modulatory factor 1 DNA-binding domain protein [Ceratobasidium sp. AG-Ba]|nr:TATA element modulatory factor 1 DNA-binding domain protein [Ceratobasidium sp. AG-Ba]QRW09134.1 TATA element modulatory factor 1 DNA-binding domain protein [Ceratobasidium sp. AG-Ba]